MWHWWLGGLEVWMLQSFQGQCLGILAYECDEQAAAAYLTHDAPHQWSVSLREFREIRQPTSASDR